MGDQPTANPGYAAGELAKALQTGLTHADEATRERAERKGQSWLQALSGMASGLLHIGSRQPVAGFPAWVTPEVMRGGFASGNAQAGGEFLAHEVDLARRLGVGLDRRQLNQYFLSAPGLETLQEWLASGCYRVDVPEEAALLVLAWLGSQGQVDQARLLLQAISPFFDRLRFYPVPQQAPRAFQRLRWQSPQQTVQELRQLTPRPGCLLLREVVQRWIPLQDRVVSLWLDTLEGPEPTLEEGRLEGGWPCQHYPEGWLEKARACLLEVKALSGSQPLWRPQGDFLRLVQTLEAATQSPSTLSGREVGFVRRILACFAGKRGLPGSARHGAVRQSQAREAALPLYPEIARVLVERLQGREDVEQLDTVCCPVTPAEASRFSLPAGTVIGKRLRAKVARCWQASLEELVQAGVLGSGEMLARMLPQLACTVHASGFDCPQARRLFAALYVAFSQRRSLLLLSLQHQVRLAELPWASPMLALRTRDVTSAARSTLIEAVTLSLSSWPFSLLPNKLLRELDALGQLANLKLPLVEEVAADIFVGAFSEKFLRAAQLAAPLLKGTIYQQYYGLPYSQLEELNDGKSFAELCRSLAKVSQDRSVVNNGKIIEQAQLLTTQNLAVLWQALDLARLLGSPQALARSCLDWVCRQQRRPAGHWRGNLKQRSRCAYAWRQMVFWLAQLPPQKLDSFWAWATPRLQESVARWLRDLQAASQGQTVKPLLGWVSKADLQG